MNGKTAKNARGTGKNKWKNFDYVEASADAVLAVNMNDLVLPNRVPQIIVGLCRAAFTQSKVMVNLARGGLLGAAKPNQRLFFEAAMRLVWLNRMSTEERIQAADNMLQKDRDDMNKTVRYLQEHEVDIPFDVHNMNMFPLETGDNKQLKEQVRNMRGAADSVNSIWPLYAIWKQTTMYTHASGALAGEYAPTCDSIHLCSGKMKPDDANFEGHRYAQCLIAIVTGKLLISEHIDKEMAERIPFAFFNVR